MKQSRWIVAAVLLSSALHAQTNIPVDAKGARHAISPYIYGIAWADGTAVSDLNATVNRQGGNPATRYNWQVNASNRGEDYFFESISDGTATQGELATNFVQASKGAGAEPMLTIPMIGWVAKLGANRDKLASFRVSKYGAQEQTDQWMPDAGNGVRPDHVTLVTGNDPNDASILTDSLFQKSFIQLLTTQFQSANAGGVRFYCLDNEPSIWHSSHRDVFPTGVTLDQMKSKIIDYGTRIKEADPGAILFAPEEWGWSGFFSSGYDQQYSAAHGWDQHPDRDAHGGADYIPWLLGQMKANEQATGKRILDVLSVHYYPQGGEFGDDVTAAMQAKRNRSTRGLWDPNYVEESWIADTGMNVYLIPRLKQWVAANYPGTKIALTEYNWGAEGHISGALAQADVMGILGREGIDYATRWTTPDAGTPAYSAFKMYRNYDGAKSTFGDISVSTTAPSPDNVAAFGARRTSDGALTLMVINKQPSTTAAVNLNLANFTAGGAVSGYRLTSSNSITALPTVNVAANTLSVSLPPQSVTLYVVPSQAQPMILWRNSTNGSNAYWLMKGMTFSGVSDLPALPNASYEIVGAADFDKNGSRDVVWRNGATGQNAIWMMNGATLSSIVDLPAVTAAGWVIQATGDINNDGNADVLWRNTTNGANSAWLMNGTTLQSNVTIAALPNTSYRIQGTGDLDGDGKTDIVWRNASTGQNAVWLMNGTNFAGVRDLPYYGAAGAEVGSVADMNDDGNTDIVWRNNTTGQNAVWLMSGTSLARIWDLPAIPATNIKMAGPR